MATRKKRAPWDIFPGPAPEPDAEAASARPELFDIGAEYSLPDDGAPNEAAVHQQPTLELVDDSAEDSPAVADFSRSSHEVLEKWHQRYEETVSSWIETHQEVLADISASGLQVKVGERGKYLAGHEELAPKMREAIASHPSPVMRAELSAMHVAGEASVFAMFKGDYETARRQHLIYVQYRDEWIERLRQFSKQPMSNLRAVMNTDEFELEEIRAALETALIETEAPEDAEPHFEAPIVVRDGSGTLLPLEDHPAETREVVGTPDDTTGNLEGGRVRRLLRRLPKPKTPKSGEAAESDKNA